MGRIKGIVVGALGIGVMLIVLFGITYVVVHYTPSPVSKAGKIFERFAQPHS